MTNNTSDPLLICAGKKSKETACKHFVPIDDDLFCAFVIKDEEIDAHKLTDYNCGFCGRSCSTCITFKRSS